MGLRRFFKSGVLSLLLSACAAEHIVGSEGLVPAVTYPSGLPLGVPSGVVVVDVDGDARADVVLVSESTSTLCVLPGLGDGTLGPGRCQYVTQLQGQGLLAAARVQGTGVAAGAALFAAGDKLLVLQRQSDGNFAVSASAKPQGGANALSLADLDGDGKFEVLVAEAGTSNGSLLGTGSVAVWPVAGFQLGAPFRFETPKPAQGLLARDLDGDGRAELAVLSPSGLSVYGPRGPLVAGQCSVQGDGLAITSSRGLAAFDADGDGALDLVTGDGSYSGLFAWWNNGAEFSCIDHSTYFATGQVVALADEDFDRDGKRDLVAATYMPGRSIQSELVLILGGFPKESPAAIHIALGGQPMALGLGDLDGDGGADAVVALADGQVAVVRNTFGTGQ